MCSQSVELKQTVKTDPYVGMYIHLILICMHMYVCAQACRKTPEKRVQPGK